MVAYSFNLSNLEHNKERIINSTLSFAQQSMIEFVGGDVKSLERYLKANGFVILEELPQNFSFLYENNNSLAKIKLYKSKQFYGFMLDYLGDRFVAQKDVKEEIFYDSSINLWFVLQIVLLLLIFGFLLTALQPLKVLKNALEAFARGKYDLKIPIPKEPQQAMLALSFNNMASKISHLLKVRELVLRNIGHELKTPIAKARLSLEFLPKSPHKDQMARSINDLDHLITKILTFEKIQEGRELLDFKSFGIDTLMLETLGGINITQEDLELELKEIYSVYGDLHFLSIVIKNLIENAHKYKSKGKILVESIRQKNRKILSISNFGEPLSKEIGYYSEPFYRDSKHEHILGYGLGLSIVKGILELHNFILSYEYKEGRHYFLIDFGEI